MTAPSLLEQWDIAIPTVPVPEKVYYGRRDEQQVAVIVVEAGDERELEPCAEQRSTGFEWGYNGAGPTALAAAILTDHLGYVPPIDTYIAYRRAVVSRLRRNGWAIATSDIADWLATHLTQGRP